MRRTTLLRLSFVTLAALFTLLVSPDLAAREPRMVVMEVRVDRTRLGHIGLVQQQLEDGGQGAEVPLHWHSLFTQFEGETVAVAGMGIVDCDLDGVLSFVPQAILFSPDQLRRAVETLRRPVQPERRSLIKSLLSGADASWFGLVVREASSAYAVSVTRNEDFSWSLSDLTVTSAVGWSVGSRASFFQTIFLSCEIAWRDLLWDALIEADPWDIRSIPAPVREALIAARTERGALYEALVDEVSQIAYDIVAPTTPGAEERAKARLLELVKASYQAEGIHVCAEQFSSVGRPSHLLDFPRCLYNPPGRSVRRGE